MNICPHCGKEIEVPMVNGIHTLYLTRWNTEGMIQHRKVTTGMKKAIDKVIKAGDYTQEEIFTAFKNYATILKAPQYFWDYQWTMAEFLKRGLDRFVDEARPFANIKKDDKPKSSSPYNTFDCGGSSY